MADALPALFCCHLKDSRKRGQILFALHEEDEFAVGFAMGKQFVACLLGERLKIAH